MNYLLDTHIFIWALMDKKKLSSQIVEVIENTEHDIFVSAISFWEISLKFGLGKLQLDGVLPNEFPDLAIKTGFKIIDLDANNASYYHTLKGTWHKDPFDRMLICQAIKQNYILISNDEDVAKYYEEGLKVLR